MRRSAVLARLAAGLWILQLAACSARVPYLPAVKREITAYHDSGAWRADVARVIERAERYLSRRLPDVKRPAVVLDVDETAVWSWEFQQGTGFGFVPELWHAWVSRGEAPPVAPTLDFFRRARQRDVAVFFVTSRRESQRAATEEALRFAGYDGWQGLFMRPDQHAADSAAAAKTEARRRIEAQGYTIVVNLGDQMSDLAGGHAERSFKLPNPVYFVP